MLRASAFQLNRGVKYGVIGAGALGKSLIGQLPAKSRHIGPVAGISLRVASRIANSLRAGHAARTADELNDVPVILFHSPQDQLQVIAGILEQARIDWKDKTLIFCDCEVPVAVAARFRALGADTAVARQFGVPDAILLEGDPQALVAAQRLAAELHLRPIEITAGTGSLFDAAVALATAALTPLVNRATDMLRGTGLRDKEAVEIATALFQGTIAEFGHSGRQSWAWHVREPDLEQLGSIIAAVDGPFLDLFRELILAGFAEFGKHPEAAAALHKIPVPALPVTASEPPASKNAA